MILSAPVQFDWCEWREAFPELQAISRMKANMAWNVACVRINNGCAADIVDVDQRKTVLYYLTAHIAVLSSQAASDNGDGTVSPGMTGRISEAEEGSVSVSTEAVTSANAGALERWLSTTQYGQMVWIMIEPLFGPFYIEGHPNRTGYMFP